MTIASKHAGLHSATDRPIATRPVSPILEHNGRLCALTTDVGIAVGVEFERGLRLVDIIRNEWGGQILAGRDFALLRGHALGALDRNLPPSLLRAGEATVLYASGIEIAAALAPDGAECARWVASVLLPKVPRRVKPKAQQQPMAQAPDGHIVWLRLSAVHHAMLGKLAALRGCSADELVSTWIDRGAKALGETKDLIGAVPSRPT